nr:hypothetical protein [Lactiplantibacillus plantarum]
MKTAILFSGQGQQFADMGPIFIKRYQRTKPRLTKLIKCWTGICG